MNLFFLFLLLEIAQHFGCCCCCCDATRRENPAENPRETGQKNDEKFSFKERKNDVGGLEMGAAAAAAAAILSAASRRLIGTLRFSWNRSASQWRPANRPSRDWPTTNRNAPSPTDRPAAIAVRERERQGEAGRGWEREGEAGAPHPARHGASAVTSRIMDASMILHAVPGCPIQCRILWRPESRRIQSRVAHAEALSWLNT